MLIPFSMYRRYFKPLPQSNTRQKRRSDSPKKKTALVNLSPSLSFALNRRRFGEPPNPRFWFFGPFQRSPCPHCQSAFWSNVWFDSKLFRRGRWFGRRLEQAAYERNLLFWSVLGELVDEISSVNSRIWIRVFGWFVSWSVLGWIGCLLIVFTSFSRSDWWVWLLFFGVCFERIIGGVGGRKRWIAEDLVWEMGSLAEISPDLDKLDGQISDIFRALS